MQTKLAKAIEHVGGPAQVAEMLGESHQTINNWVKRGVPVARCADVERVLRLAVRRWDLRPDDWWRVWPELIGVDGAPAIPEEQGA